MLLREAENLRMRKFKRPYNQKLFDKEKKQKLEYLDPRIVKYEEKEFFHANEAQFYEGGTFETILSEAEIGLCVYRALTSLQLKKGAVNAAKTLPVSIYPPLADEALTFYLLKHGYISEIAPLHSRSRHKENHKDLFEEVMKSYDAPVGDFRYYYGEAIAIYFEWCNYMSKWLLIPGIIAVLLYIHEKWTGSSTDSAYLNSYFSFGISLWAPLLVIFWQRRCSEVDVEWDNYNLRINPFSLREQFVGELRINPITDTEEYHYEHSQRLIKYLESFVITLPFIGAALFVMLSSLNALGYSDKGDYFYMPAFAALSEPGAIFEKGSKMAIIPSIIMTVLMLAISKVYEPTAEYATFRENHKTKENHLNSVNIKKFIFNFIFFFSHLFYVSFVRMDLSGLRKELIILAVVDELRRVVTESAVPTILQNGLHFKKEYKSVVEEELDELNKPHYTYFEDYLELVIQYGYVTMFAAAFPMGATINLIFLFFERRSDSYKIERLCRRPLSLSASDIGIWDDIMKILSYTSVFTNLFLFAFASSHAEKLSAKTHDCQASYYFISIEHVLIAIIYLSRQLLSDKPKWVRDFLARAEAKERKQLVLTNALSKLKAAVFKVKTLNWVKS